MVFLTKKEVLCSYISFNNKMPCLFQNIKNIYILYDPYNSVQVIPGTAQVFIHLKWSGFTEMCVEILQVKGLRDMCT